MDDNAASPLPDRRRRGPAARSRPLKRFWRKVRQPLTRSRLAKNVLASVIAAALRFVHRTNRPVADSDDLQVVLASTAPAIGALWHGQHLLAPTVDPGNNRIVTLFSRSADAEINALVVQKLGFGVVRGSGGREGPRKRDKGGARALIALKKELDVGTNVVMIADIPHGVPRQAGLGIVTLARVSGRPIVPLAVATSRRKVLERSWDKTTINLPFGRRALALGEPIHVPAGADATTMEEKRREVTAALNAVTQRAYEMVDGPR